MRVGSSLRSAISTQVDCSAFWHYLRSAISTHVGFACVGIASGLEKASSDWAMCECVLAFALCARGRHFSAHIGKLVLFVVQ